MSDAAYIPLSVLTDDRLTRGDLKVYGVLSARTDGQGKCSMTRTQIEETCHIKCAGQGLSKLLRFGYVGIERNAVGTTFRILQELETEEQPRQTLSTFAGEYVSYLRKTRSQKYAKDAERAFQKLRSFAGDVLLSGLSPVMLETFFADSFKRAQFETAKNYRTLKAAFSHAVELEYLQDSPFKKVKLPKLPKPIPSFLNESELTLILDHTANLDMKDIFTLAFHTGLRLSELVNLEWQAVNLTDKTISVSNSETFTTKNKKERLVPVNQTAHGMLTKRQPKVFSLGVKNYVFSKSPGQRYKPDSVSKSFKKGLRAAGLNERLHFHSLRHSTASNMVRRGVPIVVVKEILGHSNISTTMAYSHIQNEDKIKAVRTLESVP